MDRFRDETECISSRRKLRLELPGRRFKENPKRRYYIDVERGR